MKLEEKFNSSIPNWLRHYLDDLTWRNDKLIDILLGGKEASSVYGTIPTKTWNSSWYEWRYDTKYAGKIPTSRKPLLEWDKITFHPGPVPTNAKDPRIKNKDNILFMEVQTIRYGAPHQLRSRAGLAGSMEVTTDLYIRGLNDDQLFKINDRTGWSDDERGSGNRAYKYTKMNNLLPSVVNFCYIDSQDVLDSSKNVKEKEEKRKKERDSISNLNNKSPYGYSRFKDLGAKAERDKKLYYTTARDAKIDKSGYIVQGLNRFINKLAAMQKDSYAERMQEWSNTIEEYDNHIFDKLQKLNKLTTSSLYLKDFDASLAPDIRELSKDISNCKDKYTTLLRRDFRDSKNILKAFIEMFNNAYKLDKQEQLPDRYQTYIDPETGEEKNWFDSEGNVLRPYEPDMWMDIVIDTIFADGSECQKKYGRKINNVFTWNLPYEIKTSVPANDLKRVLGEEKKELKLADLYFDQIMDTYNKLKNAQPKATVIDDTEDNISDSSFVIDENYKNHLTKLDALVELKDED